MIQKYNKKGPILQNKHKITLWTMQAIKVTRRTQKYKLISPTKRNPLL